MTVGTETGSVAVAVAAAADDEGMEQWDLTATISPYLDRHMVFPLLDYLEKLIDEGSIHYPKSSISEARLALLRPTHMVDYAIESYTSIHGADAIVPAEMNAQKEQVLKDMKDLEERCAPLLKVDATERVRFAFLMYLRKDSVCHVVFSWL